MRVNPLNYPANYLIPEISQNSCKYIDIVYLNFDHGYPKSKHFKLSKLECSYTSWKPTPVFLVAPLREKPQKVKRFR